MAFSVFKSFRSTVSPFLSRDWFSPIKLLVDPTTGAPMGILSPNANGPDGIWGLRDITAAQAAAPTAAMLADLDATYRLNVSPYTRYQSNGVALVTLGSSALGGPEVEGPGGLWGVMIAYSPVTIVNPAGTIIEGTVQVRSLPA